VNDARAALGPRGWLTHRVCAFGRLLQETLGDGGGDARGVITVSQDDDGDTLAGQVREDGTEAGEVADGSRRLRAHERGLDGSRPWADDPRVALALRLFYTAAVIVVVIWLLRNGNPVGGLLLVPAAAVWLRREAESGRLTAHARRAFRR
jgi:hypothetical protein